MKVIFLDFDGVLNPMHYMHMLGKMWKESNGQIKSQDDYGHLFFEPNVKALNHILYETDANIVVSSTWRLSGKQVIKNLFFDRNMNLAWDSFIDITPDNAQLSTLDLWLGDERGYEIKAWLDKHPEVESYVIIDDNSDMLEEQMLNFVKTNMWYGLTMEDAEKAIKILNKI
jgi:hypothetical protein